MLADETLAGSHLIFILLWTPSVRSCPIGFLLSTVTTFSLRFVPGIVFFVFRLTNFHYNHWTTDIRRTLTGSLLTQVTPAWPSVSLVCPSLTRNLSPPAATCGVATTDTTWQVAAKET